SGTYSASAIRIASLKNSIGEIAATTAATNATVGPPTRRPNKPMSTTFAPPTNAITMRCDITLCTPNFAGIASNNGNNGGYSAVYRTRCSNKKSNGRMYPRPRARFNASKWYALASPTRGTVGSTITTNNTRTTTATAAMPSSEYQKRRL